MEVLNNQSAFIITVKGGDLYSYIYKKYLLSINYYKVELLQINSILKESINGYALGWVEPRAFIENVFGLFEMWRLCFISLH